MPYIKSYTYTQELYKCDTYTYTYTVLVYTLSKSDKDHMKGDLVNTR